MSSFHPIVVGSLTFNAVGEPGTYALSTLNFSDPFIGFKISGGSYNPKTGLITASIAYIFEKDVTVGSSVERKRALQSSIFQIPKTGFSSTEVDAMLDTTSTFITSSIINSILQGRQ